MTDPNGCKSGSGVIEVQIRDAITVKRGNPLSPARAARSQASVNPWAYGCCRPSSSIQPLYFNASVWRTAITPGPNKVRNLFGLRCPAVSDAQPTHSNAFAWGCNHDWLSEDSTATLGNAICSEISLHNLPLLQSTRRWLRPAETSPGDPQRPLSSLRVTPLYGRIRASRCILDVARIKYLKSIPYLCFGAIATSRDRK